MKHLMALLAMFLAMPMFANLSTDDELTHKEVQDTIMDSIAALDSKVASLQTALATAQSAITALQGAATRHEVAIVMTVPDDRRCMAGSGQRQCYGKTLLMGSTIPGFPQGTVNRTTYEFTDSSLPAGTYLVELQQPYSDNLLCHGSATAIIQIKPTGSQTVLPPMPAFQNFRKYMATRQRFTHLYRS